MAWCEKLKSGRYRGGYRDARGKKSYVPGTFAQDSEALRKAGAKEDEQRTPGAVSVTAGKMTWGSWVEEWWPKRRVEASTAKQDSFRLKKHLEPKWAAEPLNKINRDGIQDWVNDLDATDMSASTVQKCYHLLSASLKAAMLAKKIPANPCASIILPVLPPADEHYLEHDEYAALREALPEQRHKVLCDLLVGTGCRWGEIAALHQIRFSKPQGRIDVVEAYDSADKEIKAYTKGKKKRGVPITAQLSRTIEEWLKANPARCTVPHKKGSTCRTGLILHEAGLAMDYDVFQNVFEKAVAKAGIGRTRIHDLRHTYASWLIQKKIPLDQISPLLGHASLQTTQRYAHLAGTQWDSIRDVLDEAAPRLPHAVGKVDQAKIINIAKKHKSS